MHATPLSKPLFYSRAEARLTVFHEEVLDGVGVSNGLSSVVQVHHIGTEDVHVVLALEEQSLCAPLLGGRQQEMCRCVGDTCSVGKACSSELALPKLCWEEGLFPQPHFSLCWSLKTVHIQAWSAKSQVTAAHSLAFLSFRVFSQKGKGMQVCLTF